VVLELKSLKWCDGQRPGPDKGLAARCLAKRSARRLGGGTRSYFPILALAYFGEGGDTSPPDLLHLRFVAWRADFCFFSPSPLLPASPKTKTDRLSGSRSGFVEVHPVAVSRGRFP